MNNSRISKSRTYIVLLGLGDTARNAVKFVLPENNPHISLICEKDERALENNTSVAVWYYLNCLDRISCLNESSCYTAEEILGVTGNIKFSHVYDVNGDLVKDAAPVENDDKASRKARSELFQEMWRKRNPCHEINANTEEDMFWETAEMVAREYVEELDTRKSSIDRERADIVTKDYKKLTTEYNLLREYLEYCALNVDMKELPKFTLWKGGRMEMEGLVNIGSNIDSDTISYPKGNVPGDHIRHVLSSKYYSLDRSSTEGNRIACLVDEYLFSIKKDLRDNFDIRAFENLSTEQYVPICKLLDVEYPIPPKGNDQMILYITFGQTHTHRVNNHTFDKDSIASIKCETFAQGRKIANDLFGMKFGTSYEEGQLTSDMLRYFPRGILPANH